MRTFKKILKYTLFFVVVVFFLWFSYGLYLHVNLPTINIADKKVLIDTKYTKNNHFHSSFYENFQHFVPENRIFHNKKTYETFPVGLPEFTRLLKSKEEYSLCFSDINKPYQIYQTYKYAGKSEITGYDYSLNPYSLPEGDIIFSKVFDKASYPYEFSLIKGNNCGENIVSTHKAEIKEKDDSSNFTIFIYQIEE